MLVLNGAQHAQGRTEPLAVVEDLDELEDGLAGPGQRGPGVAVDQLVFQGREPALADGVVPALGRPGEALDDVVCLEELGEIVRGVLAAPVGVNPSSG